jgi:hypothetical protein
MSDTNLKPKEERLKETITILKKLKEIGVPSDHHFYNEIKERMSEWVNDGEELEEKIDFVSHWAELNLPVKKGRVASLNLKAKMKDE